MQLQRTMDDKVIGGVCGGIARSIGASATTVRWVCALCVLLGGLSAWLYVIAWIFIPADRN